MLRKKQIKSPTRSAFNRNVMLAIESAAYRLYPTIKDFCKDCQLDPSNFSQYKSGEVDPSLDMVAKMLDKCQISVQFTIPQLFKIL